MTAITRYLDTKTEKNPVMQMRCFHSQMTIFSVSCMLLHLISKGYANDHLDSFILESLIPSSSQKCRRHGFVNGTQVSIHKNTDAFPRNLSASEWNDDAYLFEYDLFLTEMSHVNYHNSNHSWRIRIGQGGNIYSFQGAFGEAMPPQHHTNGEFVDEVIQSVSVNQIKNRMSEQKYFIHQSGSYRYDRQYTSHKPFFSPSIAKYCYSNECLFATWGQQANIPTFHQSDIFYLNRYVDCGDGVLEFTSVIHNAATDLEYGDDVSYLNVPWGGVRKSTFRDFFISNQNGELELQFPQQYFGQGDVINENDTGGYSTFAEQVVVPEEIYNKNPFELPHNINLVVTDTPVSRSSPSHSAHYNLYCSSAKIRPTTEVKTGCKDCNLLFHNLRTGDVFHMQMVLHWAWNGNMLYFCTKEIHNFNTVFAAGDEISVTYSNVGKPYEDNLALTFVHGFTSPLPQRWASSRIRFGSSGNLRRDYNVYTANRRISIKPGDTYVSRQYIVVGNLSEMEATSKLWVEEAKDDLYTIGEMPSVDIHLYSFSSNASTFGAYVSGTNIECLQGSIVCTGKATPHFGMKPHFVISCGDKTYVGPDKYHFSPARLKESDPFMPYVCEGERDDIRPKWKLLGFFIDGKCSSLENSKYIEDGCNARSPSRNRAHRS